MPDLLPAAEALAEKRCLVTLRNQPDFVLLQPIDARDTLSQEMPLLLDRKVGRCEYYYYGGLARCGNENTCSWRRFVVAG